MNGDDKPTMAVLRELVGTYKSDELELCTNEQIQLGENACLKTGDAEMTINLLAKASYVSSRVSRGESVNEAMRALGKQMRMLNQ